MINSTIDKINKKTEKLYHNLKLILWFQLIFGYYYDFLDNNYIILKCFLKSACLLISSTMSIMLIKYSFNLDNTVKAFSYLYLLEYFCAVILLLLSNYTYGKFYKTFHYIDEKLSFQRKHYFWTLFLSIALIAITMFLRGMAEYILCHMFERCNESIWNIIISLYPVFAVDFLHIMSFINFQIIYTRLKVLREMIEDKYCFDGHVKCWHEHFVLKKYDITYFQDVYKSIADNVQLVKPFFDALVSNKIYVCLFLF